MSSFSDLSTLFLSTRLYSNTICQCLETEDYIPQPAEFVSPPKWHLAHTTWFFEEMILKQDSSYKPFNEDFSFLFNSYYESLGKRVIRSHRGLITRPTVEEVYAYRAYVDNHISALLKNKGLATSFRNLIELGIHHEQQHQELLITDLKYTFSLNPTHPIYNHNHTIIEECNEETGFLNIDKGIYSIGTSKTEHFCFDNETNPHQVLLESFSISKALVTNKEYIAFINSGGYSDFKYWHSEGWSWVQSTKAKAPLYWKKQNHTWYYYTLSGLKPVNPDAILTHINFYEASAFAAWSNMRLPTEFEWEVAAKQLSWGKRWEWTNSAYLPYPGFEVAKGAVGEYNGKFMISQMVLRGCSSITPKTHRRITYRNFFHPKFSWQYTGLRLLK